MLYESTTLLITKTTGDLLTYVETLTDTLENMEGLDEP